jgi:large subunit ribosomal protein L32
MAHPKSRISKQRRNTRRTHYKATARTIATCPTTGQPHLYHRAHWHEGRLYYKGKVVMEKAALV